ncbi:MAG: 4-(cytidine 5'-diphospho)-2-C-methyl-D-erythritol kinase [Clostridia bacterium]|nr:4-(cytidine 5'-diphospho)-2-C-methyl-D-erythritol kinase [Clostridia bacterium]
MKRTAYCKINLTLEILGTKRNDGFHDIKSIMHKIPLGDIIELDAKEGSGKILFSCDSDVCDPKDNLAYRAAECYLEEYAKSTDRNADVTLKLTKITPTGAGLGGGSADAATVLDMLQELLGGVSDEKVLDLASGLGSDVPFCLGRYMSAVCTGRGEICRNIDTLPRDICLVVAKPEQSINTKGIYGEYDTKHGDDYSKSMTEKMEKALKEENLSAIAECLMNDFEEVCIPRLPAIAEIKEEMLRGKALCSQMSGSGSAVFGIFKKEKDARACFEALKNGGLSEVYFFAGADFEKMYKGE